MENRNKIPEIGGAYGIGKYLTAGLSRQDIDEIYRIQRRAYWEDDFVNRCIERKATGTGSCSLPYESLADEKDVLDMAYNIYEKIEDCNVSYNETLEAVIDEMGRQIGTIPEEKALTEKMKVQAIHLQMVKDQDILYGGRRMDNPQEAARMVKDFLGNVDRECLVVCAMDAKMHPVYVQVVGMGSISQCPVSIPDIFKAALLSNASNLVLFHNHPSGDTSPSSADFLITERVKKSGELLGVQLQDHIILGDNGLFYSMRKDSSCFGNQENQ